ncbi:MAG: DUF3300 domain-containing protein [Fibrobacter sp.]|nr:DUF3300 domain-containing protein [Fibrobacter sp.]
MDRLYSRLLNVVAALVLCFSVLGFAQANYSTSELDTLVANIALYPDPLLVQVLDASTYGNQIPAAAIWAEAHKNMKGETLASAIEEANLPYDPSVLALLPFPSVLSMMDKYRTWTDQLGDAVTNQKEEVMEAVQRMRQKAYDYGHLKTNEQVKVVTGDNITIYPVQKEYVYVPVYNPRVVYYVRYDGYTRVYYGQGVWLGTWFGEWGWGSCWIDWGPRVIYVRNTRWYAHRPIPRHPRRYRPPHHYNSPPPRRPAPAPATRVAPAPAARMSTAPAPARVSPAPAPATRMAPAYPVECRMSSEPAPRIVTVPAQGNAYPAASPAPAARRPAPAPGGIEPERLPTRYVDSDDDNSRRYDNRRSAPRARTSSSPKPRPVGRR